MMIPEGARAVNGFQRDLVGKINKTWPLSVGGVVWKSAEKGGSKKA